jgi:hypothetical protein
MVRTAMPNSEAASVWVYSWSTMRLSIMRSKELSWLRHISTSRTKMTASSKVRTGRLETHPRQIGSHNNAGALPTCMEAYR